MNRPLIALTLLAALAAPSTGLAQTPPPSGPPPLGVKVLMVTERGMDVAVQARNEALLQTLGAGFTPGGGWFDLQPSGLDADDFNHCTISAQDPGSCVRRLVAEKQVAGDTVIILAWTGRGTEVRWLCTGTGGEPANPGRQAIAFDMDDALDATSPRRMDIRAAAAGCITSAGAESGW